MAEADKEEKKEKPKARPALVHRASSKSWGDAAYARLCQCITESNSGMAQQIAENRHDLLDLCSLEDLQRTDDLGLTLQYLAVYYDRPEMIEYLHKRGVNLGLPCDPIEYGTPMFYAITLHKQEIVQLLDILGYSVKGQCNKYEELPLHHAERLDDPGMQETIEWVSKKEERAVDLFTKHYLRIVYRKEYLLKKKCALVLHRVVRGWLARLRVKALRKPKKTDKKKHAHRRSNVPAAKKK